MSLLQLDKYLIEYIASLLDYESRINLNRVLPPELRTGRPKMRDMNNWFAARVAIAQIANHRRNFTDSNRQIIGVKALREYFVALSTIPHLECIKTQKRFCANFREYLRTDESRIVEMGMEDNPNVIACHQAIQVILSRLA